MEMQRDEWYQMVTSKKCVDKKTGLKLTKYMHEIRLEIDRVPASQVSDICILPAYNFNKYVELSFDKVIILYKYNHTS